MKVIKLITIFCLLFHCYACTRTLIRSEENDLREFILADKAYSVTDRNGHKYDLRSPNIYSVSNDTLHFTLKKTGRVASGSRKTSIPLTDINAVSISNPTSTVILLLGVGIGVGIIFFVIVPPLEELDHFGGFQ